VVAPVAREDWRKGLHELPHPSMSFVMSPSTPLSSSDVSIQVSADTTHPPFFAFSRSLLVYANFNLSPPPPPLRIACLS